MIVVYIHPDVIRSSRAVTKPEGYEPNSLIECRGT